MRQHLVPSQGADPTRVDSGSPTKVAQEAIGSTSKAGIKSLALDYWPSRPARNREHQRLLEGENIRAIRFCLLYETWDLGYDAGREATPVTPSLEAEFNRQLLQFARTLLRNPQYLSHRRTTCARPVPVKDSHRRCVGNDYPTRTLLEKHGFDPFLIGDEVFWRVTEEHSAGSGLDFTKTPQRARIGNWTR